MDDAVVGKTEEEDDEDGPAPCADTTLQVLCADTLQDSLRTVQSLMDAADCCALAFREYGQHPWPTLRLTLLLPPFS